MRMKYSYQACRNYIAGKKKDHAEGKKLILDFNPPVEKEGSATNQFYISLQQNPTYNNVRELLRMRKYSVCIDHLQKALEYCDFMLMERKITKKILVMYIYGDLVSGKTYLANQLFYNFPIESRARGTFTTNGQLFGVHNKDSCIFYDDLPTSNPNISYQFLYQLLDSYEFKDDGKNNTKYYNPDIVIISRCENHKDFQNYFN